MTAANLGTILLVGRFLPHQGGTASANLCSALALSAKGWTVEVVTTWPSEPHDRVLSLSADHEALASVMGLTAFSERSFLNDIAAYDPARLSDVKAVFSSYFDYFLAGGAGLARKLDVPHVVSHAGSDFSRLVQMGKNFPFYGDIESAACVISNARCAPSLRELGLRNVCGDVVPFNPWQADLTRYSMPWERLLQEVETSAARAKVQSESYPKISADTENVLVVGFYGKLDNKLGGFKSHYSLLRAIKRALIEGVNVALIGLAGGPWKADFEQEIRREGLKDHCSILPYLAPWHVQTFVKACDVIVALEDTFWVNEHNSQMPLEIMAGGACGVFARSTAARLKAAGFIEDSFLAVEPPFDRSLFDVMTRIGKAQARQIGDRARSATSKLCQRLDASAPRRVDDVIASVVLQHSPTAANAFSALSGGSK